MKFLYGIGAFAIALFLYVPLVVEAGTLSCSITTAAACTNPSIIVMRMGASTNTHAELPSQTTGSYASNVVCCSGVSGLGNTCGGTFAIPAKLSAVTNAQIEQNSQSNFANNTCLSVTSGSVSVGYQASNCTGFDTTLASMTATTNAHPGSPSNYTTKICGTATAVSQSITFSLGSNVVNLSLLSTASTATGSHTMNVSTNASSGMDVTVQGATLTSGANTIASCGNGCSSSAGTAQFGINLVANTVPALGSNPSGTPTIGIASYGYDISNNFRLISGESVASSLGAINATTYTVSYIANISPATPAGSYNTSLVFVATANF